MAYPNFYNPYPQNYYNPPMPDQLTQLRQNYQPQSMQPMSQPAQNIPANPILWVQGEEGAKAYMVAAGNTVLLMDSDGSSFYLKSADASGMPLPLRIFDYTERTAASRQAPQTTQLSEVEYVTRKEFDDFVSRMELTIQKPKKQITVEEEPQNG